MLARIPGQLTTPNVSAFAVRDHEHGSASVPLRRFSAGITIKLSARSVPYGALHVRLRLFQYADRGLCHVGANGRTCLGAARQPGSHAAEPETVQFFFAIRLLGIAILADSDA